MTRRRFYFVLAVAAAWSAFVVLASIPPVLGGIFTWHQAIRMTLNQWFPWMMLSPLLFWFTLRIPMERNDWLWRISAHLIVGALAVLVCAELSDYFFAPVMPAMDHDARGFADGPPPFNDPQFDMNQNPPPFNGPQFDMNQNPPPINNRATTNRPSFGGNPPLWARVRFNIPIYLTLVSLGHTFAYLRRSQQRDRRALALEAQLGQARLQALRMQLHPHFLFNTLNAISTLVQTNPPAANEMIGSLGQMLRLSLDSGSQPEVPLEQELKFLDCYLEIEQIRFGDRLKVKRDIAPETSGALVPTFILQPLVENAIRHGIEPDAAPGAIEVSARRKGGVLFVSIRDTGVGLAEKDGAGLTARGGIGLANTKARLHNLYPGKHSFLVRNVPGGGCAAELEMPFHTKPTSISGVSQEA